MEINLSKKTIKPLLSYATGNGINFILPLFLLPIFTSILSKADYGVVANTLILFQLSAIVVSLGSNAAVSRAYWDKDTVDFRKYIGTSVLFNLFVFLTLSIIGLIVLSLMYSDFIWPMILILFSGLLVTLKDYKFKLWNVEKKYVNYSVFNSMFSIINYLLALVLIFYIFPDWRSRVVALFSVQLIFCFVSLYFLLKENKILLVFDFHYFKDIFNYGFPLVFHGLGIILLSSADKLIVSSLIDISSTGLLAVAAVVASLMTLPIITFDLFINPIINNFLKENSEESLRGFSRFLVFNGLVLLISGLALYLLTPFIFNFLIGEEFHDAESLVAYLIIGQCFYGLYRFFARTIFFSKKTHLVTLCTILSGVIGLATQYFLVSNYGLEGACIGNAFGYFLSFLFSLIISKRLFNFKISLA